MSSQLLASPGFHRIVHNVHKRVRQIKHGKDPEEMGGTNIDSPWSPLNSERMCFADCFHVADPGGSSTKRFIQYYVEELKDQMRGSQSLKK